MDYGNKTSKNFEKRKTVAELFKRDDHGVSSKIIFLYQNY